MGVVYLRTAAIVIFKCPAEHRRVGESICLQSLHKVVVPLLVDDDFLLFSFGSLAGTFDWMLVLAHQGYAVGKECFFRGVTFATVQQSILAVIIFGVIGNTGNGMFQDFFDCLYRLSPSLNV